jgi:hypothetical protein
LGTDFRTISICCLKCGSLLYKYCKYGTGGLVKCFLDGITEDRTRGDMKCPSCQSEVPEDSRFCSKCGSAVHASEEGEGAFTKTLSTPRPGLPTGSLLAGKYQIEDEIGHGGTDYLELQQFVKAVREKTQTPIDVYDSVLMCVIIPLSGESIAKGGAPIPCPDFTGGKWKTNRPRFAMEA